MGDVPAEPEWTVITSELDWMVWGKRVGLFGPSIRERAPETFPVLACAVPEYAYGSEYLVPVVVGVDAARRLLAMTAADELERNIEAHRPNPEHADGACAVLRWLRAGAPDVGVSAVEDDD